VKLRYENGRVRVLVPSGWQKHRDHGRMVAVPLYRIVGRMRDGVMAGFEEEEQKV
jgi:hypothetical protein